MWFRMNHIVPLAKWPVDRDATCWWWWWWWWCNSIITSANWTASVATRCVLCVSLSVCVGVWVYVHLCAAVYVYRISDSGITLPAVTYMRLVFRWLMTEYVGSLRVHDFLTHFALDINSATLAVRINTQSLHSWRYTKSSMESDVLNILRTCCGTHTMAIAACHLWSYFATSVSQKTKIHRLYALLICFGCEKNSWG